MIPLKDLNPTRRPAYLTVLLILVNVGVFLFLQRPSGPDEEQIRFTFEYAAIPCEVVTGEPLTINEINQGLRGDDEACTRNDVSSENPEFFPSKHVFLAVVFSMFLHGGWLHLGGNMLFLWIFGNNIEDRLGLVRYLLFYLGGGLAASAAHIAVQPSSVIPVVGASGAIAAVMGAYLVWHPNAPIKTIFILFLIFYMEIKAKWLLAFWFISQFFTAEGSGVAWVAHVGGFVFGVLVALVVGRREPPRPVPQWQPPPAFGGRPY